VAYCPPELLADLAAVLAEVRTWPGVVETKPHVFYVRRDPFLHFHLLSDGRRRADVKTRAGWVQVDLPVPASALRQRTLVRVARAAHAERMPAAVARLREPRSRRAR
jgi:hypothetical protein